MHYFLPDDARLGGQDDALLDVDLEAGVVAPGDLGLDEGLGGGGGDHCPEGRIALGGGEVHLDGSNKTLKAEKDASSSVALTTESVVDSSEFRVYSWLDNFQSTFEMLCRDFTGINVLAQCLERCLPAHSLDLCPGVTLSPENEICQRNIS